MGVGRGHVRYGPTADIIRSVQRKRAIAARTTLHEAFPESVGRAYSPRVAPYCIEQKPLVALEPRTTEDGLEPRLQIARATFQQSQRFLPRVLEAGTRAHL